MADESQLDGFLDRLGKRDAHLRPGIGLECTWSQEDTGALDRHGILVGEVRSAVTEVLSVIDEPLPPSCQARHPR